MYWLLNLDEQEKIRHRVDALTKDLSTVGPMGHDDQLWPFVGRKNRHQAYVVIEHLTDQDGLVCDPFVGSGTFAYATRLANRRLLANEYEIYTNRMANAPWQLPPKLGLENTYKKLNAQIQESLDVLYKTVCPCGREHVLDSLFYDRTPLRFTNVKGHERLGKNGETITYRGQYKCPSCGRTEKVFDEGDQRHLDWISSQPQPPIFNASLIENSRINLSATFTRYGALFPHRSKLALDIIWRAIKSLDCAQDERKFLEDIFLSIIPQAKYKDYRSKSQDLHCPEVTLREVNLLYRFRKQFEIRIKGLSEYKFSNASPEPPIQCKDFREFLTEIPSGSVDLVLTDPPWCDGNAYFEKAQLYHPWLQYSLANDQNRLRDEVVVSDAPTRTDKHEEGQWWQDIGTLFNQASRVLKDLHFLALFFRPVPAKRWLQNLNLMKLLARREGFEPLLCIDVSNSDPSMRIQQSASYAFTSDTVFLLLKIPLSLRRRFINDIDIDQIVYQVAEELQESLHGAFTFSQWREAFTRALIQRDCLEGTKLGAEDIYFLFSRYTDKVADGQYLPKPVTPFADQLFDTPAIERLATYVPHVIFQLAKAKNTFTYGDFLIRLAGFVENGTRSLIGQIESVDICKMIEIYAEPLETGKLFRIKQLPDISASITSIIQLDPYDFEKFVAKLLVKMGFSQVALVGRSGDRGVDIVAIDSSSAPTVIQCKRYLQANVSSTPVQRLDSYARTRKVRRKILITTSNFTPQAIEEATITSTELINGKELEGLLMKYWPNWSNGLK